MPADLIVIDGIEYTDLMPPPLNIYISGTYTGDIDPYIQEEFEIDCTNLCSRAYFYTYLATDVAAKQILAYRFGSTFANSFTNIQILFD